MVDAGGTASTRISRHAVSVCSVLSTAIVRANLRLHRRQPVDRFVTRATAKDRREYWHALYSVLDVTGGEVQGRNTAPDERFADFAIGRGGFSLCARRFRDGIAVEMSIVHSDADRYFSLLEHKRRAIHRDLGYDLCWLPRGSRSTRYRRVSTCRQAADYDDRSDWPKQHSWFALRLNELHGALAERILQLPLS